MSEVMLIVVSLHVIEIRSFIRRSVVQIKVDQIICNVTCNMGRENKFEKLSLKFTIIIVQAVLFMDEQFSRSQVVREYEQTIKCVNKL